ncbi:HepT-like ribonuclease domain-containing protein [Lactococcus garvieae]|uniref:HepT-like ribonuclease domain-containing protein n=1 Tax=Lactococcus garvieae TaxID=1363 RepID=UPI00254FFEB7|nr:HepT-like ribonuclease domain-containing protein [Lactococcus garvieae]
MVYHAEEALKFFSQIDNSEECLFNDSLYQKGISKSLEQMGEMLSVGRISEELQERYDCIPWRAIKGYRNMAVNEYDRIDWSEVSALLKSELRGNIADLQMIIRKERMKNKQL